MVDNIAGIDHEISGKEFYVFSSFERRGAFNKVS